jgi:nucleoside-triphosphatase THEP1
MNLAYTMAPGRGDADLVLHALARDLAARGLRCCGTVQINAARPDAGPCDMDVRVLPDGPILRISQDLGRAARGCRLDPTALETAVGLVAASLDRGADVVIINKFGKHEAEGRGFRTVIAEALSRDIPVLVGVNAQNLAAFHDFAQGLGQALPCDCHALADWITGLDLTCHRAA